MSVTVVSYRPRNSPPRIPRTMLAPTPRELPNTALETCVATCRPTADEADRVAEVTARFHGEFFPSRSAAMRARSASLAARASSFALAAARSEEHTSELQSLMRISYAVFCLKKKKTKTQYDHHDSMNTSISNTHKENN